MGNAAAAETAVLERGNHIGSGAHMVQQHRSAELLCQVELGEQDGGLCGSGLLAIAIVIQPDFAHQQPRLRLQAIGDTAN